MEYQPKKTSLKSRILSRRERIAHIPKIWYIRSLPILFFVLVLVGTSIFLPTTLRRLTDFLGITDTFIVQTSEGLEKSVYMCTDA